MPLMSIGVRVDSSEDLEKIPFVDVIGDHETGVEIQISEDRKTVWVNMDGRCVLRVGHIKGPITVT